MSSGSRGIQSVEVGNRLLSVLVDSCQPLMLRDMAAMADIAPAQAHAYLVSYRKLQLVEQDPATGQYRLGPFAMRLGMARIHSNPALHAGSQAAGELSARLGVTVAMLVWGCDAPTVVEVQQGPHDIHINLRQGTVFSLTGTISGRVFAAFMDQDIFQKSIERELAQTPDEHSVKTHFSGDREELDEAIATARRQGYLTTVGIAIPGISAVSAPVLDASGRLLFVLTLIGPEARLDVRPNGGAVEMLLETTRRITANILTDDTERAGLPTGRQRARETV